MIYPVDMMARDLVDDDRRLVKDIQFPRHLPFFQEHHNILITGYLFAVKREDALCLFFFFKKRLRDVYGNNNFGRMSSGC